MREHAHDLIDRLQGDRLAAVVRLLEVMVDDVEDEAISPEEEAAVQRSKEWFQHNEGIPFEQIVADLGFTMDQIRSSASNEPQKQEPAA